MTFVSPFTVGGWVMGGIFFHSQSEGPLVQQFYIPGQAAPHSQLSWDGWDAGHRARLTIP